MQSLSSMMQSLSYTIESLSLRAKILTVAAVVLFLVVGVVYCVPLFQSSSTPTNEGPAAVGMPAATPKNIPALTTLISSPDQDKAILAVQRLQQINTSASAAPLLAAMSDNRPPVQAAVITALVHIQTTVDPAPFMAVVESTPVPAVKAAALDLLAVKMVRTRRAYALMVANLEDPDPEVRGRAYAGIRALTGRDYSFRAEDPPEKRADAVRRIHMSPLVLPP